MLYIVHTLCCIKKFIEHKILDTILPFISPKLQGGLVEESSEIASARVSSIYRKSFCRKTHKNINLNKCKKLTSLSKISEEDSDNTQSKSDNQKSDEGLRKVHDKEMFSDKAATSSTSDNNSSNDGNEVSNEVSAGAKEAKTDKGTVSRFIPEIMSRYRVTIVWSIILLHLTVPSWYFNYFSTSICL